MNKKAFTLVELLATIAILAIMATITAPIIIDVFNSSASKAFEDNVMNLSKAADTYYTSLTLKDNTKLPILVTFNNGKETNKYLNNENKNCETSTERLIQYSGQNPDSGNIFIDKNGDIYIAVYNQRTGECGTKNPNDKTVTITKKSKTECKLDNNPC